MDIFFFQLAIIFLPGLLWERIVAKYGVKRPPTQFETALRTFTFGLTAYAVTYMIYGALGQEFLIPEIKKDAAFIADRRYIAEFIIACAVAVTGALVWLYVFTYRWFGRFLRKIGATKKYGDEDTCGTMRTIRFFLDGSSDFRRLIECGSFCCVMCRSTISILNSYMNRRFCIWVALSMPCT